MAGMTKLILLMILAAVSFLPQDGVDALECHMMGGGEKASTKENCPNADDIYCSTFEFNGTKTKGCISEAAVKSLQNRKGDCGDLPPRNGKVATVCFCKKALCNSTARLHGHFSSVLSLCVVPIILAISFLGKP